MGVKGRTYQGAENDKKNSRYLNDHIKVSANKNLFKHIGCYVDSE